MSLSPKQAVYQQILAVALPHLRNVAYQRYYRANDRSARYETELIHELPRCAFEPSFGHADIYFLNAQARNYCERCNSTISPLYRRHVRLIRELFALVPWAFRPQLQWPGPDELPPGDPEP